MAAKGARESIILAITKYCKFCGKRTTHKETK